MLGVRVVHHRSRGGCTVLPNHHPAAIPLAAMAVSRLHAGAARARRWLLGTLSKCIAAALLATGLLGAGVLLLLHQLLHRLRLLSRLPLWLLLLLHPHELSQHPWQGVRAGCIVDKV